MTNKQKIYLIIQERRLVSLTDLYDITNMDRMQLLTAVSHLVIRRKIKALTENSIRYFAIKDKSL
jgi:hypothetical protein